jgi:hypothetical protein
MTLGKKGLFVSLSVNDTQNNDTAITLIVVMLNVAFYYFYAECHYAERHYAECRYADCSGTFKIH